MNIAVTVVMEERRWKDRIVSKKRRGGRAG
jgi:hypothetical protein